MTQTDQLRQLYPLFLDCGYSPLMFAKLSPAEIADVINSYRRQQAQKQQEYLLQVRDHISVMDAAIYVLLHNLAIMMPGNDNLKYMAVRDIFPDIFADDTDKEPTEEDGEGKLSPEMQVYKAQRMDHAYRHNAQREKG